MEEWIDPVNSFFKWTKKTYNKYCCRFFFFRLYSYLSAKIKLLQVTVLFLLFLALLLSFSIAYFQYYYKEKTKHQFTPFLLILRALSLFLLFSLFINPSIENEVYQNEKPVLSLLTDNSSSIAFFNEPKNMVGFQDKLNTNSVIKDKFEIQNFQFGKTF